MFDVESEMQADGLHIQVVMYEGLPHKGTLDTDFGPNDHYIWQTTIGQQQCACQFTSQGRTPCADKQIEMRINQALLQPVSEPPTDIVSWEISFYGGGGGGMNQTEIFEFPNLSDPTPNDQILDFLTYFYFCDPNAAGTPDCSIIGDGDPSCLSPMEMSFYTQGTYDALFEVRDQNLSQAHEPLGVILTGTVEAGLGPTILFHEVKITFGIIDPVE